MSETAKHDDIEDVLSSIRRLVSDGGAKDNPAPVSNPIDLGPDRLVLTPQLRVTEPENPYTHISRNRQDSGENDDAQANSGTEALDDPDGIYADGDTDANGVPRFGLTSLVGLRDDSGEPLPLGDVLMFRQQPLEPQAEAAPEGEPAEDIPAEEAAAEDTDAEDTDAEDTAPGHAGDDAMTTEEVRDALILGHADLGSDQGSDLGSDPGTDLGEVSETASSTVMAAALRGSAPDLDVDDLSPADGENWDVSDAPNAELYQDAEIRTPLTDAPLDDVLEDVAPDYEVAEDVAAPDEDHWDDADAEPEAVDLSGEDADDAALLAVMAGIADQAASDGPSETDLSDPNNRFEPETGDTDWNDTETVQAALDIAAVRMARGEEIMAGPGVAAGVPVFARSRRRTTTPLPEGMDAGSAPDQDGTADADLDAAMLNAVSEAVQDSHDHETAELTVEDASGEALEQPPEPVEDLAPTAEPEHEAMAEPEFEAEAEPELEAATEPDHEAEPEFEAEAEPQAEVTADPEPVTDTAEEAQSDDPAAAAIAALDEASLRELIAQVVREELQGTLGQRITRNVRKMVRREIRLALAAEDFD